MGINISQEKSSDDYIIAKDRFHLDDYLQVKTISFAVLRSNPAAVLRDSKSP